MPTLTNLEYARLRFRVAVGQLRDAHALRNADRHVGVLIACQHAWEMIGKTALAIEAGIVWPPPKGHWMGNHRVLSNIDSNCSRLKIKRRRTRTRLSNLERWLPPAPNLAAPPVNTEYFFYGGGKWYLPHRYFGARYSRAAILATSDALAIAKDAYPELAGISVNQIIAQNLLD